MNLTLLFRAAPLGLALCLALALVGCETQPAANDNAGDQAGAYATPPTAPPANVGTNPRGTADQSATNLAPATPAVAQAPSTVSSKDTTAAGPPAPGGPAITTPFEPAQMQQAVRNFADQYRQTIASACDYIIVEADDNPDLRRRAQAAKIHGATAMYDIAVDPVPASAMLNAAVTVSLQANFLRTNGHAHFGEYAPMLIEKSEYLQEEIFRICARVMPNDKRVELLNLINQWSEQNPTVTDFWYVRLTDLPGVKSGLSVGDMVGTLTNLPSKFLNVFNPFASTGQSVTEAQALAERMSWLTPRLMILAQWRAEAVVYDSIANTRLPEALDLGNRFATVAENLPDTLDQQRTALFADLEANRETIGGLLGQTENLTANTNELLKTVDQITARVADIQAATLANRQPTDPDAPPGRPFDITEYTAALGELHNVVIDANALLLNANDATTGAELEERLDAVQATVRNLILLAAFAALAVALLIVLAVKFIPSRRPRN